MEKSTSISALAKSLITFQMKVDKVSKDASNPFFKSKYASLSNILEAIQTPLAEAGLSFCQFPTGDNGLTTILMHGDTGEFIQDTYTMKPVKDDPQGKGSTITYQRRYAIAAILGLNIDDDDDGNAGSRPVQRQQPRAAEVAASTTATPSLTDKALSQAVERIKKGETDLIDKLIKGYALTESQKAALAAAKPKSLQPA